MLGFLIVLFALSGIQGKAFPSRYKRNYGASYHYIPYEEGIVRIPAGYSPENFPNYQDYINGYVQPNRHHWPVYYDPSAPFRSVQNPYSNANAHHKMKAQHNWHFIEQNHIPITRYNDGMHQFDSGVEVPNGVEAHGKKDGSGYEVPIGVKALAIEDNVNHVGPEIPIDSLTFKGNHIDYEYEKNPVGADQSTKHKLSNLDLLTDKRKSLASYEPVNFNADAGNESFELPVEVDSLTKKEKADPYDVYEPSKGKPIKNVHNISPIGFELSGMVDSLSKKDELMKVKQTASYGEYELPAVDSSGKKEKTVVVEPPAASYYTNKPVKEKPIKEKPVKEKPIKEKPVKEKPIKEKPVKEKPIKDKPVKEKPIKDKPVKEKPIKDKPVATYDASDYPFGFNSLIEAEIDYETPVIVESLIRRENPSFQMGDHETPVVVEALVRKPPPENENGKTENKVIPKDSLHSGKETISTGNVMNVDGSDVEALSSEEDIASNETPEQEVMTFEETEGFNELDMDEDVAKVDPSVEASSFEENIEKNETPEQAGVTFEETDGFNEPDMNSFETADEGSSMDFDGSHFSKSFHPDESDLFSEGANIKEQPRRKFKSCVTLKKETGRCMPFQLCSLSSAASNIDELLRNVCIIDEVFLGVCCPEFPVETVRVDWEQLKPDADMINENSSEISKECGKLPPMVTDQDPWPWMALLIARSSDKIFCGGALISEQYVLTAAHCTKRIPRNQILVRLGSPASESNPEQEFEVIEIKRHSGYNPRTMQNDVALLKLSRRVRFGDSRRTVCLAKDEEGVESLVSEPASLLRWKETPGEIKDVESLSVISSRECQNRMRTAIADSILCTEPRTSEAKCNADSGAPLIIAKDDKFEVIGILTWNRNDCDERFPTVFTRVSSYDRWIEKLAT